MSMTHISQYVVYISLILLVLISLICDVCSIKIYWNCYKNSCNSEKPIQFQKVKYIYVYRIHVVNLE